MPTTSKGLRYPSSTAAPNGPQAIQDLATDVDGKLFTNAGTSATAVAGTAAPAGTSLQVKIYNAVVSYNASGDGTAVFPGGAFPNGLLGLNVQISSSVSVFATVTSATTSLANIRVHSGSSVWSGNFSTIITAWGW